MLAPQDSEVSGGELDELAVGDGDEGEEGSAEAGVPAGSTYFPSSMGMSFVIAADIQGNRCRWRMGPLPAHQEHHAAEEGREPGECLEARRR